ncbi:MAG: 50S ribosomal protein L31 [Anaerolineae bacterium]|nr:50S ribosomal protein L31 [Anaerolineae bacterium]
MKSNIHPKYYPNAQVICSCGNTWTTGSTVEVIRTDVCSQCHPFFTGEQRIVDSAGQVDRFLKRLDRYSEHQADMSKRQQQAQAKINQRFLKQKLVALELSDRIYQILQGADVVTVGDLAKMDKDRLLALEGFGPKALEEVETKLQEARAAFLEA